MPKHLILVAGNIGSGKTSLTERIGERLGWKTAYESVADNPYLADFYGDMKQWSFHLQVFFLGHRAEQHLDMCSSNRSAIIDRSIYEDAYIFVRALRALGNITERDYQTYWQIYNLVVKKLPPPSLLIYLKAPVDVLMARIHSRGREMESTISADYLKLLDSFYDDWMNNFDLCPALTLRTDDLDFVHKPQHLDQVVERIQNKLAGKEEIVF
ncbi:Deoxyadenosine/deoxycytidine kinase [bioreactor metagenome]|uniref:Deoxyadenosine/deoxycytidine kinase n=1 Tax=bioreactor metagenome TaxID=1076179 RepID=A0A645B9J2_9ZZZZ